MPDTAPDERHLLLTLATPDRVMLLHNRDWHVFHETAEMVMLRMVHDGSLVAQCNISPSLPSRLENSRRKTNTSPKSTPRRRNVREWWTAQKSMTTSTAGGFIMFGLMGKAGDKPLIWDYFLCTAKSGQQISFIFSYAEEDRKLVAGSPEQMLGTLTVRSNRPKVALPP